MPGVRGTFAVENQASGPLREMRTDAASTKQAFRDLGVEMDKLGANTSNLDRYKRALSDMSDSGVRSLASLNDSWDRSAASTSKSVEVMKGSLDDLQVKMREIGDTHVEPNVNLRGVDETLAKLELIEAKLKELNRQSARPSVSSSGGGGPLSGWGVIGGSGGSMGGALSSAASDAEGLGAAIPSLAIKAAAALPVIESLTGATAALVSSMTGAALGAGGVGLAGGGALAVGLGSIMAVAKPTLTSIENVFKAESSLIQARTQATMPGLQQTQQLRQVVQAENALQQAQVQSRLSQIALTEARRQARNSLVNLGTAAQSAALGEKQAALTLASSQRALYEAQTSPTSTPLQVQQAELAVQQARLGIKTSAQQDKEAHESLSIARRQGVNGNPQVMSARNAEEQSVLAIRNARWSLEEARKQASGQGSSVEQARQAYNYALSKAPEGTKQVIAEARSVVREWKDATHGATRDFMGILAGTLGTARGLIPTMAAASTRSMGALSGAGSQFGGFLTGAQNTGFITQGSEMFSENVGAWEKSLTNIAGTVENIIVAARPFLREASTDFEKWTASWDRTTGNLPATRATLGHLVEDARDWSRMWLSGWHLLHDIMHVGGATQQGNNMLASFTKTMDRWDVWVKNNPQKVKSFFKETREGAEGLARAVGQIAHDLTSIATQLQPLMKGGLGALSLLNNTGLMSSVGGLGGLYGVYGALRSGARGLGGGGGGLGGGGGVVASPGATAAAGLGSMLLLNAGGASRGEMVGNVRTMPNVAMPLPGGGFVVSSASGRAVSADAQIIAAREAAAAGSPFVSIAESGAGRFGMRGAMGALGGRLGAMGTGFARIAAPYVALNDALTVAGGGNPFKGSSPVSGILGGAGQGALMGAALGSVVPVLGTGVGAAAGGIAGGLAGVISNAGALHKDIFGESTTEKAIGGWEKLNKQLAAVGGNLEALEPAQLRKLNEQAVKLQKQGNPALKGVALELQNIISATGKSAQETDRWSRSYGGAVQAMASASHRSLGEVVNVANTTAEGIKQELGGGSAAAKEMLARNFGSAAQIVQQRMQETGQFTREGVAIVERELDRALSEYGLHVPKGVTSKAKTEVLKYRMGGDKTAGFGAGGAPQDLTPKALAKQEGHATGGRLPGFGSYDTVKMSDGGYGAPGELVVNRHTEARANWGLARAGMPSLGELVAATTIPHSSPMRATGGVVGMDFPFPKGEHVTWSRIDQGQDFEGPPGGPVLAIAPGVISQASDKFSGFGPFYPTEQITGGPLKGRGVYYGHTKIAKTGPVNAGDVIAYTQQRANQWTAAPAGWLELGFLPYGSMSAGAAIAPILHELASSGRVAGSAIPGHAGPGGVGAGGMSLKLGAPTVSGIGLPGTFANAGIAAYAAGLSQKLNEQLASSAPAGSANYAGVKGHGGDAAANEALGKAMMLAHGWPIREWPALQKLWTKESGWSATAMNNPSMGWLAAGNASGIPQSDGHGQVYRYGDARGQIAWGLDYIAQQYGSPSKAWAFEISHTPNWYGGGGRLGGVPRFVGAFKDGGSFTTRPGKPVSFIAGEGAHTEDVKITPRRHGTPAISAVPKIDVSINIGDVIGTDPQELRKVISEASDEAARKLLAALRRRHDRIVAGTVAD